MHFLQVREGAFPKKLKKEGGGKEREREREREGRRGGAWRGWVMVMEEREASSFYGYGERGERSLKLLGQGERGERIFKLLGYGERGERSFKLLGYGGESSSSK